MGTYRLQDYGKVLMSRAKALKHMNAPFKAAKMMVEGAVRDAPMDKGETKAGITMRPQEEGSFLVESYVHGSFKHNMWANRTPPFDRPRMVWNKRNPTPYGNGTHNITGKPMFFDLNALIVAKKFPQLVITEFHKIMRSN